MKKDRASRTATFVAFARGAASSAPMTTPALHDEAVRSHLLSPRLRRWVPRGPLGQAAVRVATFGFVDHIALRTAAIDAAIDAWVGRTARGDGPRHPLQLVILGAGLDTRAYRLPSLDGVRVFEVDHPASQAVKRDAVRGLTPRCLDLRYVGADFMEDGLDARLEASGHDRSVPTAWILEGVTMYLPEELTRRLFVVVAERSAPASVLALTYTRAPEHPLRIAEHRFVDFWLGILGEPFHGVYEPEALERLLHDAGLELRSDTSSVEWSKRFGASAALAISLRTERLVVAEPVSPRL